MIIRGFRSIYTSINQEISYIGIFHSSTIMVHLHICLEMLSAQSVLLLVPTESTDVGLDLTAVGHSLHRDLFTLLF